MFCTPPPLFLTGAPLGDRGEPRGAPAARFVTRERRLPALPSLALPSRLCGRLPGVTRAGSMRLSLRGKKPRNLCANTWKQLALLHSSVPMVRVYRLRVQWGESAGSHATPAASARSHLATRGQESPSLSQVSEGRRGRRWKGTGLPEEPAAKRTWAHEHLRGPAPQRGATGPSPAGRRNPLWPRVGETQEQL